MVLRQDYAFPLRIDSASQQTARAPTYPEHVEQMIEQVLLTTPGERVNLPQFGCGLRQLLFAPVSDALQATMRIQVMQALGQALGGVIHPQRRGGQHRRRLRGARAGHVPGNGVLHARRHPDHRADHGDPRMSTPQAYDRLQHLLGADAAEMERDRLRRDRQQRPDAAARPLPDDRDRARHPRGERASDDHRRRDDRLGGGAPDRRDHRLVRGRRRPAGTRASRSRARVTSPPTR